MIDENLRDEAEENHEISDCTTDPWGLTYGLTSIFSFPASCFDDLLSCVPCLKTILMNLFAFTFHRSSASSYVWRYFKSIRVPLGDMHLSSTFIASRAGFRLKYGDGPSSQYGIINQKFKLTSNFFLEVKILHRAPPVAGKVFCITALLNKTKKEKSPENGMVLLSRVEQLPIFSVKKGRSFTSRKKTS